MELYKKTFSLELGYHVINPDGTYFHSELYKDGRGFSVVEATNDNIGEYTVQIRVTLNNEAEVRKAYTLLSEDGIIKTPIGPLPWSPCAADVIDKFGVWWYLLLQYTVHQMIMIQMHLGMQACIRILTNNISIFYGESKCIIT